MTRTMRRTALPTVALAAAAGLVLALFVSQGQAGAGHEPQPPPWVNADGTVDHAKMPETLPVVDSNGKIIGEVRTRDLRRPDLTPAQARQRASQAGPRATLAEDGSLTEQVGPSR